MNKATVLKFLQENLQRLFTKSPKFFKIWTLIAGALVLVTGIPELITALPFHIAIPDLLNAKLTVAIAWSSRAALFMSLLTTQSTPVGVTKGGNVIKVTNESNLPFTAATENKAAAKNNVDSVVVSVTPSRQL